MEDVLPEDDPFLPFWSELHAVRSSRFSLGITGGIAIAFSSLFFLCCLLLLPPSGLQQWQ